MFGMPTQRYKLTIAYRGTRYHGWQSQVMTDGYPGPPPPRGQGIPTIQGEIVRVLEPILQHPISLVGSSRTDSGVHAKGQVAHFDTERVEIPRSGIRRAANHQLPGDIFIRSIEPVPETFDAILSTGRKRYQYSIFNSHDRTVFQNDLTWHRWKRLDLDAMRAAAAYLVGEHDFASFCRPGHKREHTIRTLFSCDVSAMWPRVVIGVEGSGFLWNMVRIIVGTLVQVGVGQYKPEEMPQMLVAKDRRAAGPTAPPHGLYLHWVRTREPTEVARNAGNTPVAFE
jgi:tRNA pseudouridine38-40 synthase